MTVTEEHNICMLLLLYHFIRLATWLVFILIYVKPKTTGFYIEGLKVRKLLTDKANLYPINMTLPWEL